MSAFRVLVFLLALFILFTALARLHDILRRRGRRWMLRKIGMACTIVAMSMVIGSNFATYAQYWIQVTILLALSGWSLTWFTTPNERPWWSLITRYDPHGDR